MMRKYKKILASCGGITLVFVVSMIYCVSIAGCQSLRERSPNLNPDQVWESLTTEEQILNSIEGLKEEFETKIVPIAVAADPLTGGISGLVVNIVVGVLALITGVWRGRNVAARRIGTAITIRPDEHADLWRIDPALAAKLPPDPF